MERRGGANNPAVKAVAVFAVALFLALNLPAAFYTVVAAALSYATALVAGAYAYRKGYGKIGKPELVVRFAAKILANLKEECDRTVAHALQERERRKRIRREREQRLRRYERERNRRKREHARRAYAKR